MTTIQFRDDVLGKGVKDKFYFDCKRNVIYSPVGWARHGNSLLVKSYNLNGEPMDRDFSRDSRDIRTLSECLWNFRAPENIVKLIRKK